MRSGRLSAPVVARSGRVTPLRRCIPVGAVTGLPGSSERPLAGSDAAAEHNPADAAAEHQQTLQEHAGGARDEADQERERAEADQGAARPSATAAGPMSG